MYTVLLLIVHTCLGAIGLLKGSDYIIDVSFDILSMAALFLVPRICSVMSLNPYFGSLVSWMIPYGVTEADQKPRYLC
jgi:hypothetical protein